MPIWIAKIVATRIIKAVKHKIDLNKIDKYVNKPNELDKQMKSLQKTVHRNAKYIEELEKDVAILKRDSHPPLFTKRDKTNINKQLKKLENKEK